MVLSFVKQKPSKAINSADPIDSGATGSDVENHARVRPYWDELAGLRTLSFLAVFFYHYGPPPVAANTWLGYVVLHVFDKLFVGVDIFFVLSGFLITALLLDERSRHGSVSLPRFFLRRTLRIFPLYFAVLAVAAVLPIFTIDQRQLPVLWYYYKKILLPATFFFANFAFIKHHQILEQITNATNQRLSALLLPLWSLCVEEHFYTLWAPAFKQLKTLALLKWCCALVIGLSVAFKIYFWTQSTLAPSDWATFYKWFYNSLCRMDGLMIGALTAICFFENGLAIQNFFGRYKAIIGMTILTFVFCFVFMVPRLIFNEAAFVLGQTLLPWCIAGAMLLIISVPFLKKMFSVSWLTRMAKYSYSAYLVHYFILQSVVGELQKHGQLNLTMPGYVIGWAASLLLTLLVSWLSWIFLEKNLGKLRKRFAD